MSSITLFILPNDSRCELGEGGWIFESKNFVPDSATQKVIDFFNTPLNEEFLEIKKYQNDLTQINVVLNNDGKVNEIFIRTKLEKENVLGNLSRLLSGEDIEVFDPSESTGSTRVRRTP